jgi:thymidine phosphorylase
VELGAGRRVMNAPIDPGAGFHITIKPGDTVTAGEPIATVYGATPTLAEAAGRALLSAIEIGEGEVDALPLIAARLGGETAHAA